MFLQKAWSYLKRIVGRIGDSKISLISAGVAFYGLFSLFPLIIAFVSIYSLISDPNVVESYLHQISDIIPVEVQTVILQQLREIVRNSHKTLGWGSVVSILGALWSANQGTKAMIEGFNAAYQEKEKRGFIKLQLLSLSCTLGVVLFLIFALAGIALIPALLALLPLKKVHALLVAWGRWPILASIVFLGLATFYRYAPSRSENQENMEKLWLSPGSLFSSVLWLIVSAGFSFYVSNFGKYNQTYGSLGGVIVLLLWLYLSSFIILVGAILNAEKEHSSSISHSNSGSSEA